MNPEAPSPTPPSQGLLSRLPALDRDRLGEAMRRLLTHGSILGLEPSQNLLYQWCFQNRSWLEDMAALVSLKLHWDHDERTVQAIPEDSTFLLRIRLDATLVLLTLWYEFDSAIRDRGESPPIRISAQQLNDSLLSKFEPLRKHLPSPSRLREILALAQRKNLLRFTPDPAPDRFFIEVFTTLKRVIPFQGIDEWNQNVERHLASALAPDAETETTAPTEPGESSDTERDT
jgi:hypothetical protein